MSHADTLRGMAKAFMMVGSHEQADTCLAGAEALDARDRVRAVHAPAAVAEVIRLRKAIAAVRDDYLAHISDYDPSTVTHMCYGTAADDLTRILEGGNDE